MKELNIEQVEQVSGGIFFVPLVILAGDLAAGITIGMCAKLLHNKYSK